MSNKEKLPKGITKRNDGRYVARFNYDRETYTLYGTDVKKLEKELADKKYEVEHGIAAKKASKISLNKWFESWMKDYKKEQVKYGTFKLYGDVYTLYIEKKIGKKNIGDIRPDHIQRLFNQLSHDGLADKTVRLVSIVLNGCLKQAYKNQMIPRNPVEFTNLPRTKGKKRGISVMTSEEMKVFFKYAKEYYPYYNAYIVLAGTGMRVGELRALRMNNIDFAEDTITIEGTLKYHPHEGYMIDTPKTETSEREIPMIDEVKEALKRQIEEKAIQKEYSTQFWAPQKGLEDLVFTTSYNRIGLGTPISNDALNVDMKKILSKIREKYEKFPNIHPHTLRHCFATSGLGVMDMKIMQEILGHSTLAMTSDIYTAVLTDKKREGMSKMFLNLEE